MRGNILGKIVRLDEIIPTHTASLSEDFLKIEEIALKKKQDADLKRGSKTKWPACLSGRFRISWLSVRKALSAQIVLTCSDREAFPESPLLDVVLRNRHRRCRFGSRTGSQSGRLFGRCHAAGENSRLVGAQPGGTCRILSQRSGDYLRQRDSFQRPDDGLLQQCHYQQGQYLHLRRQGRV